MGFYGHLGSLLVGKLYFSRRDEIENFPVWNML